MNEIIDNWYFFILPLIYILGLFVMPKGVWKTFLNFKTDPDAHKKITEKREKQEKNEIENFLSKIKFNHSKSNFEFIQEKVFKAIDYAIKRHDWYENQRNRLFNIILWINGFALTFIGLIIKNENEIKISAPSILAILITIIISLIVSLIQYNKELDADRPYRLVSDIRFWFFRYNLPEHTNILKRNPEKPVMAEEVIKERNNFFNRIEENFDLQKSLREDLEQLFILHVIQRYKSQSLIQLRWLMTYTLIILILELIIFFS